MCSVVVILPARVQLRSVLTLAPMLFLLQSLDGGKFFLRGQLGAAVDASLAYPSAGSPPLLQLPSLVFTVTPLDSLPLSTETRFLAPHFAARDGLVNGAGSHFQVLQPGAEGARGSASPTFSAALALESTPLRGQTPAAEEVLLEMLTHPRPPPLEVLSVSA